jgi:hypothetical protein
MVTVKESGCVVQQKGVFRCGFVFFSVKCERKCIVLCGDMVE